MSQPDSNRKIITPSKMKLSNGLTVIYLHTKNDPISAGHLFFPVGSVDEPNNLKGLSNLMWSLFPKGSQSRSAKKMAEDLESLGAYAGAGSSQDSSSVSFYAVSEYFKETLSIVHEAMFRPVFNGEEVQKEKTALIAAIQSKQESIFTVTNEAMNKKLYLDHPYAVPASGEERSVNKIKSDQLYKWHKKILLPNQAVLSVASNLPFKDFLRICERNFGPNSWENGDVSWKKRIRTPLIPKESVSESKNSKFEQAFLMMGYPAPDLSSPDYMALKVLNGLLGGGMSARLFQSLREKNGLAYDVGCFYPSKKYGSCFAFYLGLQKSKITEARDRFLKEIDLIQNELVSEEELNQVKNHIKGTFILDHQTNSQRAHYLGWWETLGLSSDFDHEYTNEIDKITPQQIQDVAKKIFAQPSVTIETLPKEAEKAKVAG